MRGTSSGIPESWVMRQFRNPAEGAEGRLRHSKPEDDRFSGNPNREAGGPRSLEPSRRRIFKHAKTGFPRSACLRLGRLVAAATSAGLLL